MSGRLSLHVVGWLKLHGQDARAAVRPTRESRNTQPIGSRFRAVLGEEPKVELGLL